jgi:DNA-binding transcriptional regulator YiaG
LAIVEIPPDFSSLTTIDRLLQSIADRPDGMTIKELSDTLNRPISMIQICLKIAISSRKVAVKQRDLGGQIVKVYILRPDKTQPQQQFHLSNSTNYSSVTPMHLRKVAGLTKVQLAIALGLSVRTINDWEQKRSQPRLVPSQLKQMMSVYQCTIDELIAAFE